ncbi:putative WD repeat-containing protein [Wickerhamomyces ciferrii]|uniref:WD repeat-containing protein n=1 Tax=Wickerhamomyces ciferrii (strain ATCC 14091 / BCRC 22168 / CBS 111 / JCM 3599 / NBRC 0793 / NRRL Y-1031 F-60-10) TaxID=1206466 RepID=K0KKF8_WICCF|nr:putative WD repeat-containing protein [Wickerhamomyces ciferrii]CCH42642.1 putative WD repeat-containing protein [Wickerhamomyces ciferrii]
MAQETVGYDELREDRDYESGGVQVGEFLQQLENKRTANLRLIPTDDDEVKAMLRSLGEPIIYFGEDKADRRERLTELVVSRNIDLTNQDVEMGEDDEDGDDDLAEDEEFYTPGSEELMNARKFITEYSSIQAKERIHKQQQDSTISMAKQLTIRRALNEQIKKFELGGSQLVSTRPVSQVAINKRNHDQILSGSWSGNVKLLNKNLEVLKEFEYDEGKISGLDWSPTTDNLFLSSGDQLSLWDIESLESTPISAFKGHEGRIVRSKFHPSGKFIASASFDQTWRLWDIETQQQLLLQEGHSKEVYTLGFQKDGSLLASAGLDAIGHVWDLRLGKSIMILDGHIKPIYGLDWRDNGYQIATGGAEGSIKIWDLRMSKDIFTIPAHNKIISDLKFNGNILSSSSYDGTVKLYNCDNWIELHRLEGHSDKVMSVDLADDFIISSGWDRSVKIWLQE